MAALEKVYNCITYVMKTKTKRQENQVGFRHPNSQKGTMSKQFDSYEALRKWLDQPLNRKLYKVVYVFWPQNQIRLDGRVTPA
jgi:DNA-directed RNA polymerase